ncbi:MAG: ATP-binding protein [Gallionella sp.]|jgi:signal transduction histidine kinase/CheY-like chemotaxis protein|nr:ATP-binding protein [Gallionella sp.]
MNKMISARYFYWFVFCLLLVPFAARAVVLDVTQGSKIVADPHMSWCATGPTVTFSAVREGACRLQAVQPGEMARGLDGRAFWLQTTLRNMGIDSVERWVFVGHPRLEEISLFSQDERGEWRQQNIGTRTPLALRDEIGRAYGVIPVVLAPRTERTVWLRVASRTVVDLSTTLWAPAEFRDSAGRSQFSLTLALGALFVVMLLSCLTFVATRELPYLFFALSMLGELLLEGFRTGLLQRFFFPQDMAMPVETAALGSLLAVIGFTVFFHSFVPTIRRSGWLYKLFVVLVGITLLAQIWSFFIDYRGGAGVWSFSVNGVILVGIALAVLAWREGMASAGTLVFSFAFLAVLELLRLGAVVGWLPFFWAETMAGPWALVMTTPLIFLSVFQRSRELSDLLMRAKMENSAKVEFLAQMSHELRSPLNTILGNAQLLSRPFGAALSEEGLKSIQQSGQHLLGMIDEILDHARGLAGKLTLEPLPVDWPKFLMALDHNTRLLASQNNNQFSLLQEGAIPWVLLLDSGRLRQVLDNLLNNAARHTRNGSISLRVTAGSETAGIIQLDFCVSDSGDGITPEDIQRIFLPFERGSNNTRHGGKGTGMGLAISRQLVEAMGGRLRVESQSGQGSRFFFTLRCSPVEDKPKQMNAFELTDYQGPRKTVLIVDDDESACGILNQLFSAHGFSIRIARSGREAIEKIRFTQDIDLVLLDQFMADGDGWQVLREMHTLGADMPVVLMSSSVPLRPEGLSAKMDFSAFLLKPLDHSTLLHVVGELLHLTWVSPEQVSLSESSTDFEHPDEASLAILREMIDCGAMTDIIEWASALKTEQPCYAAFADKVRAAACYIDFPALNVLAGVQK